MTTTPTINKFNLMFKSIANNHEMLNDYGFGPTYNMTRTLKYPFMWVEPVNSTLSGTPTTGFLTETYQFNIVVMDKINKGDDNFIGSSSDTDYILKTILSLLDTDVNYVDMGLGIQGDVTCEPVYEETEDNSNGWQAVITLKVPMRFNPCNSPV